MLLPLFMAAAAVLPVVPAVHAWVDTNGNKIDDQIELVNANGWSFAFVNADPNDRMVIGVENPASITYAVYVRYDHKPTVADETVLAATGVSMVWPFMYIPYIESRATFAQVQQMAALPGVDRVEAVPVMYAANHYGSRVVRARDSRGLAAAENFVLHGSVRDDLGFDGDGVVIAILDTGVNDEQSTVWPGYPGHESLLGKFLGGGEFFCGQPECVTPAGSSINPQQNADAGLGYHGTHVASTAMGTGGPGGFFRGVAPGARLVDCKVLSDAGASISGSTRGLEWVIANRRTLWAGLLPGSKWQGIDVVNMSLGSTQCLTGDPSPGTDATSALVNVATDSGLVVVISSGNDDAINCINSPSSADKSVSTGASAHRRTLDRADDGVTSFSNEGPRDDDGDGDKKDEMKPNVIGPGDGIVSAEGDPRLSDGNDYTQASGTSMAAPHVAGVAALVIQANPALQGLAVRTVLENTAEHNIPSDKASGDRGQDPFNVDPNYDPSCGYGLVDAYAAVKEALDSSTGVQLNQIRPVARPNDGEIDVLWWTQREYPFLGFNVFRAPDAGGAPGAFTQINGSLITPSLAGDPVIQNDDNRTPYVFVDDDPTLTIGETYWYRVDWVDLLSQSHIEPAAATEFGLAQRVATIFYSISHDAVDNDLLIRVGMDQQYSPGTLGQADYEVLGAGENGQDSARVVLPDIPGTGTSIGQVEHFWSVGFVEPDNLGPFLPPSQSTPWFLSVTDGGFINTSGRVESFSMFVNDSPGSASGTTFVTDHAPMPQPTVEGGAVPVTLWIPEPQATPVLVATFRADADDDAVRLTMLLGVGDDGYRASVYRATSDEFDARTLMTSEPLAFEGKRLEFIDDGVEPGTTYWYWVRVHEPDGSSFMNGPVTGRVQPAGSITFARAARPNPVRGQTVFDYAVGSDVAPSVAVDVSLRLIDLQGRIVRTLHEGLQSAGEYQATWNVTDDRGARVSPGVYFLRFQAGHMTHQRKVMVVR